MLNKITPTRFRFGIQAVFTLFCLYVGLRFAAFLAWVMGRSETFVAKPGAVEAFLPISALLGLRQLLERGVWDTVHPAGLAIFVAVLLMAFVFRKGFCGYICPIGFLSNLLERLGRRVGLAKVPYNWVDRLLGLIKYGLLGFFLYAVCFAMDSRSLESFISGPYNLVADAKMLAFFTSPSTLSLTVVGVLIVLSVLVRNFWCRYLCPYGALLGLLAWLGPTHVKRDSATCIDCEKCSRQCPSGIAVHEKNTVRSPECIGCGECVGVCPVGDCLTFSVLGRVKISWIAIGVGSVLTLLMVWGLAKATGHWDNQMPPFMLKRLYTMFLH